MTDTLKQPAPSSAPLPYEPIPVGGGPAAILDIPRSVPTTPPAPRPAPPRQTQPIPAPPVPTPVPQPPVALTPPTPAPLPSGIAPEVPLTPEPNPLAGTPAPKASMFTGLVRDLIRPTRAKVAVLAGVASLGVGAFAMPLLFPSLSGGAQQPKAKVTLKVPADEPVSPATAPAPVATLPTPGPLPALNPTPLPGVKPADTGGWNPLEPALPPLPVVGGTGGRTDLPPPLPLPGEPRMPGAGAGGGTGPRMPGELALPPLPGEFPPSQPIRQPDFVDPYLRPAAGQGGAPGTPPALPAVGGPLPGALPDLPPLPGAGAGNGTGTAPVLPQPGVPVLPQPGGPSGETLPTTPGMLPTVPGAGAMPLPGGAGGAGGPALPALPALPGGTNPGTLPLPTPQPEVRPLPLPGVPGGPGRPSEARPLDLKPAQPDLPAIPGGSGLPSVGTPPRAEVERTGGTGFPTAGGPAATLQPPVSEPKTDYDVDLHRPRAGDTYAAVSKSFYGSPQYADALRTFNRNQPIERIGEVQVPPVHVIRKYAPARAAEPPPERGGDRFQPTRQNPDDDPVWGPPGTAQGGQVVYTLFTVPRKGLTLKDVAKTYYGNERGWTKLANGRNPKFDPDDELPVGTQLHVPTETMPFR